ncbi:MAG: cytochrome c oxidase accessory protein CcoG [Gammaproteobacteria bacterium]|nr:cytochrome c oxidase accessory protein CcoG [Gammaproteobacteria bacterium]
MNGPAGDNQAEPIRLEGFADRDLYQRREKIFTRFVGGFYQRLRFFTGWPLLAGYFLLPWLDWGGRQAVLFDLPARQFHILGITFWPQDLWLLGWLLIIAAFGLFTFTTLVGRIWCGYTCPQTVWTAIFMWCEQVAEGERHQRIRLDQAPWSFEKLRKRGFKHAMWLGVALLTGLTFVGYFTPIRELAVDLLVFDAHPWAMFWVAFFTAATYVNAGWMREQVCIYMCPYARFQSAMFDQDTLIVSYDAARGEPRGARKRSAKQEELELGDCIDCTLCVQVCPTGIDIRDGLQYQCIGCAHCIDACNQVMDKMGYEPGLIRYTTETELAGGRTHWLRFRSVGYAIALLVMMTAFTYAVLTRNALEVDVLRERGELYQLVDGRVVNQYRLRLLNKTQQPATVAVSVESALPMTIEPTEPVVLAPNELLDLSLILSAPASAVTAPNSEVTIRLCDTDTGRCDTEATRFLGPTP